MRPSATLDNINKARVLSVWFRDPVCGSNGRSYGNLCQMREEACREQIILEKRPMDNCQGLSI